MFIISIISSILVMCLITKYACRYRYDEETKEYKEVVSEVATEEV